MTHVYKKCPHCGHVYESYSTYGNSRKIKHGIPFKTCLKCYKQFVDMDTIEPALEPLDDSRVSFLRFAVGYLYLLGFLAITPILFLFAEDSQPYHRTIFLILAGLLVLYIFLVIYSYFTQDSALKEIRNEYQQSLDRLNDREYARALDKAGFNVPNKFLHDSPFHSQERGSIIDNSTNTSPKWICKHCEYKNPMTSLYCKQCGEYK